MEYLGSAGGRI